MRWQFRRDGEDDVREFDSSVTSFHDIVAEEIVERHFADWDYPSEIRIAVRKEGDDEWQEFDVEVRSEPVFSARKVRS